MNGRGFLIATATLAVAGCGGSSTTPTSAGTTGAAAMTFFVTSTKSTTGNLGGLRGADNLCQSLAGAAGIEHARAPLRALDLAARGELA